MQYTGADLLPNLSLRERLRRDHALLLPMFNENAAESGTDEEELDPEAYFEIVGKAIAEMPGWELRRRMVVGFFSFAKLQMYLDLDPNAWPNSCIADHDLIQRLLGCGEHSPDSGEAGNGPAPGREGHGPDRIKPLHPRRLRAAAPVQRFKNLEPFRPPAQQRLGPGRDAGRGKATRRKQYGIV